MSRYSETVARHNRDRHLLRTCAEMVAADWAASQFRRSGDTPRVVARVAIEGVLFMNDTTDDLETDSRYRFVCERIRPDLQRLAGETLELYQERKHGTSA